MFSYFFEKKPPSIFTLKARNIYRERQRETERDRERERERQREGETF